MSLNIQPQYITNQLTQAIEEMGDFLSSNPSDKEHYKILYKKIDELTLKANRKGWFNYEHKNPHKTLTDFLNENNTHNLVREYYTEPTWTKKIMEPFKKKYKQKEEKTSGGISAGGNIKVGGDIIVNEKKIISMENKQPPFYKQVWVQVISAIIFTIITTVALYFIQPYFN